MIVTRKEPAKRLGSNTEKMHAKTSLALKTTDSNDRNRPCLRSRIKDVQNRANGVKRQRITGTGADVANASCKVDKKELKLSTDQEKVRSRLTTNKRTFCRTDLSDVEGDSDGEMATRAKNARVSRKPLALEDNKNRFSAKDDISMAYFTTIVTLIFDENDIFVSLESSIHALQDGCSISVGYKI